ncbi:hypothetical protein B4071_1860 [Bacillus subtilis]|nr:hypothetical protein B4071_1860 [Bacillus subtilis]
MGPFKNRRVDAPANIPEQPAIMDMPVRFSNTVKDTLRRRGINDSTH